MTNQDPKTLDPRVNSFLAMLSEDDLAAFLREAQIVQLKFRKRILLQDRRVDAVYFPLSCMFSLLVTTADEPTMEMATIGKESVIGASEILQSLGSIALSLVQIPGSVLRINADDFLKLAATRTAVQKLVHQHMYALTRQVLFGAACNRIHSMEQRCARWLLMTHDRAGQDVFPLTQEFLSHMLGVRRATVNVAIGMLKKARLISFARGKITVMDRPGLEATSCPCYQSIRAVYEAIGKTFFTASV